MKTGNLLQIAGDLCDLSPKQSPAALARQRRFANLSITELLNRAPYLFRSDERRYDVPGSIKPLTAETISVDSDAWLLKLDTTDAAAVAQWRTDGTHCTQTIYLQPTAGGARIRRIIQGVANIGGEIYVSLTEPWPNTTDSGMGWEVLTEDFYLPKDLKSFDSVRLSDATNTWYRDIRLIGAHEGRRNITGILNRLSSSNPWEAHPGGDVYLPSPRTPILTEVADGGADFNGFESNKLHHYYITLAWGSRPEGGSRPQNDAATSARLLPLIESEASAVVSGTPVSAATAVQLSLPDIRDLVSMGSGTRSDPALVGYYFCIYRALDGEQAKLLAKVPAGTTVYTDNGSDNPDFFKTLPRDGGARSLTFDAIPGEQIIVDGTWAPPNVVNDADPIHVDETGGRALVELLVERIQRKLNNDAAASAARVRFEGMLNDLANEQGTGQDPAIPRRRRTRRVGARMREPMGRFYVDWDYPN